jgi:hypothetical protein
MRYTKRETRLVLFFHEAVRTIQRHAERRSIYGKQKWA